jgi:hypothetical protein
MAAPSKSDLDAVFLVGDGKGKGPPPPMEEMAAPEKDPDAEAALDGAIDEMFATDDPVARREAFKRALRLCEESEKGGDY